MSTKTTVAPSEEAQEAAGRCRGERQQVIANYGSFDGRSREAIALPVDNADECNYCQAAHTGGKAAGLSNDEMIAIRRGGADFDAKLDPLLTLARQYTTNIGSVDDTSWQAAIDTSTVWAGRTDVRSRASAIRPRGGRWRVGQARVRRSG